MMTIHHAHAAGRSARCRVKITMLATSCRPSRLTGRTQAWSAGIPTEIASRRRPCHDAENEAAQTVMVPSTARISIIVSHRLQWRDLAGVSGDTVAPSGDKGGTVPPLLIIMVKTRYAGSATFPQLNCRCTGGFTDSPDRLDRSRR